MSRRLPMFLGLALLVAFLLLGQRYIGPAAGRDRAWARVGAELHQQGTPTPSSSPEPPPVVCPSCPPQPSPHDAMMASDSVHQCTVADVRNLGPDGDWDYLVTCPVERYWTGCCPSSFYVPWSIWQCGLVFRPGETWLVYTNSDIQGRNVIDRCSRTAPYSDEEADQLGQSCEPASIDVRPDRTAVVVGERFEVVIQVDHAMPLPERVYADPVGLVDVVSEGWRQIDERSWYCERGSGSYGACGHLTMEARRPGTVLIGVSLYTEVCRCDKGVCIWDLAGVGGNAPPVAILPAPLYVPLALSRMPLDALPPADTAEPTRTSTARPTATATPLPSVTPAVTEEPSIAVVSGRVVLGQVGGPGLPGVQLELLISTPGDSRRLVTDADGNYLSSEMKLHNETLYLIPSKPGYCFQPETATFWHRGWPGRHVYGVEFVAVEGAPTPTPTYWDSVYAVAVDAATGDKWFGTYAGVARLGRDGGWQRFTTSHGLLRNETNVIAIDAATGDKWFGNWSGASRLRSDGTWRTYSTADGLGDDPVSAIAIDAATGDTWFGTWDGAIRLRSDGTWRKFTTADGLGDNHVNTIASDARTGDLWFGTVGGGADRLAPDGTWRAFTKANGLVSDSVFAIAVDSATGDIWFGTDKGVSHLASDGKWRSFTTPLLCRWVDSAAVDPSTGDKWFGSHQGCGATRLAGDGTWRTFTSADGLAGNEVWAIAIDDATGDRWFGTLGGVSLLTADGRWETLHVPPGQGGQ